MKNKFKPKFKVSIPLKVNPVEPPEESPKKEPKKRQVNTLPSDNYKPLIEPFTVPYDDELQAGKELHATIIRMGDLGLPHVQIQQFINNEKYKGYAKGKYTTFPIEVLDDVIDVLEGLRLELKQLKL